MKHWWVVSKETTMQVYDYNLPETGMPETGRDVVLVEAASPLTAKTAAIREWRKERDSAVRRYPDVNPFALIEKVEEATDPEELQYCASGTACRNGSSTPEERA